MFEKVFVITRKTRLAELVERFNTVGQARFYIEHAGGNFGEYEREDAVYRSAVEETRRSLPSELKVHALDRSLVPTVLFTQKGPDSHAGAGWRGCQHCKVCEGATNHRGQSGP